MTLEDPTQRVLDDQRILAEPDFRHDRVLSARALASATLLNVPAVPQSQAAIATAGIIMLDVAGILRHARHLNQIGIALDNSNALLAVDESGRLASWDRVGVVRLLQRWETLYRVRRARLLPAGATNSTYNYRFSSRAFVVTSAGVTLLRRATSGPVPPADLPVEVRSVLTASTVLRVEGASRTWSYMVFALRGQSRRRARWVPSGKTLRFLADKEAELTDEAGKMPAGEARRRVEQYLKVLTPVRAHEGGFTATSPGTDHMASLGIMQWGAPKAKNVARSHSLYKLFSELHERAQAAQAALAAGLPFDAAQLYTGAWQICTSRGLSFENGYLLLNGKRVTGQELEDQMHGGMGEGALRTYQLVGAVDWLGDFENTIVRPGARGDQWVGGHRYREQNGGRSIELQAGGGRIRFDGAAHATVGQVFTSKRSLSKALILGVNRPAFVWAALWRTAHSNDQSRTVAEYLETLGNALRQAIADGTLPRKRVYHDEEIAALGGPPWAAVWGVRAILWPSFGRINEETLMGDFEANAMRLYSPDDAQRFNRERRFATVDAVFEQ